MLKEERIVLQSVEKEIEKLEVKQDKADYRGAEEAKRWKPRL